MPHFIKVLAYKAAKRLLTANVSCFMQLKVDQLKDTESDLDLRIVDTMQEAESCQWMSDRLVREWSSRFVIPEISSCFAIADSGIVGRVWWIRGVVPPELNHDGVTDTELPLQLPDDTVFVFDACVHPQFRGRRLYAAMLTRAKQCIAASSDIKRFLISVEFSNQSAMNAAVGMGFRPVGRSMLFRFSSWSMAHYPDRQISPIQLGKYAGDRNSKRRQLAIPKLADLHMREHRKINVQGNPPC